MSRGCGWQHLAVVTNLVAYYLVAMPLAVLFAFKLKFYTKVRMCSSQHVVLLTYYARRCEPEIHMTLFIYMLSLQGLWLGMICGLACQACSLLVITARTKWLRIVQSMQQEKANYIA